MICDGCLNNDTCNGKNIDICKAYMSYIKHEEESIEEEEE